MIFDISELLGLNVDQVPDNFALHKPYPNPFNPKTRIAFSVAQQGKVKLSVFDMSGRLIRTLKNAPMGVEIMRLNGMQRIMMGTRFQLVFTLYTLRAGLIRAHKKSCSSNNLSIV